MKVAVVGPCASGKTLLVEGLLRHGYEAFQVAQEHSAVRRLFRLREPDFVVFLDASYDVVSARRRVRGRGAFESQIAKLSWALREADLVVQTDGLTPGQVLTLVLEALAPARPELNAPG